MDLEPPSSAKSAATGSVLQVYLLGTVEFEAALALQRRLVYEVAGDRSSAALILCEHPPLITVGRQGSFAHLLCEPDELRHRRWPVRWVNRGGGCLLHLPGQLAIYPILALDHFRLGVQAYLDRLQTVVCSLLAELNVPGTTRPEQAGVWVGSRLLAAIGVAVRQWVAYYGIALNINPDLEPFRLVRCSGPDDGPMTSMERERRGPLRPALVRERLLEHWTTHFSWQRVSVFSDHPSLRRKVRHDALTSSS